MCYRGCWTQQGHTHRYWLSDLTREDLVAFLRGFTGELPLILIEGPCKGRPSSILEGFYWGTSTDTHWETEGGYWLKDLAREDIVPYVRGFRGKLPPTLTEGSCWLRNLAREDLVQYSRGFRGELPLILIEGPCEGRSSSIFEEL